MNLHKLRRPSPPNTEDYDCIEVSGVIDLLFDEADPDAGTYCETVMPGDGQTPHFWSTYGHLPEGGVECIDDYPTRELALAAAQQLSEDWNIPIEDYT